MTPICVPCKRLMRCKQNEFYVKDEASGSTPATVWSGDMFECTECGAQIVTNFGDAFPQDSSKAYLDLAMRFKC